MSNYSCPRCGNRKFYQVRRGKKRCSRCLYEFKPKLGGLRLTRRQWKKIIFWFVLGHGLKTIREQTGISYYSVFKAVRKTREVMLKDMPKVFEGIVEVDETYLGGQKKNKNKNIKKEKELLGKESKRVLGQSNNQSLAFSAAQAGSG